MKREPYVRKSGLCYVCGRKRRLDQRPLYRRHAMRDAFCSRDCCERYFGTRRVDGKAA
jgi:hypothetical protein